MPEFDALEIQPGNNVTGWRDLKDDLDDYKAQNSKGIVTEALVIGTRDSSLRFYRQGKVNIIDSFDSTSLVINPTNIPLKIGGDTSIGGELIVQKKLTVPEIYSSALKINNSLEVGNEIQGSILKGNGESGEAVLLTKKLQTSNNEIANNTISFGWEFFGQKRTGTGPLYFAYGLHFYVDGKKAHTIEITSDQEWKKKRE